MAAEGAEDGTRTDRIEDASASAADGGVTLSPSASAEAERSADASGAVDDGGSAHDGVQRGGESPTRVMPRYRNETQVQPKFVLNGDTDKNAEKDIIVNAFNQGSFVGIRSLPNAFQPDFRQKLYEIVLSNKHQQGAVSKCTINNKKMHSHLPQAPTEILPGQKKQIPFSGAPKAFSTYTYMNSEYDRPSDLSIYQSKVERSRWVSDSDFKVTALPQVPKGAGSFNEFHYAIDPYEHGEVSATVERSEMLTKRLFGPLRASGQAPTNEQKKILRRECLKRLMALFTDDWGDVFHSVEEDSAGCIVLKFDAAPPPQQLAASAAPTRRDEDNEQMAMLRGRDRMVANYVSNFCQRDAISDEFQLRRDTWRWGIRVPKYSSSNEQAIASPGRDGNEASTHAAAETSGASASVTGDERHQDSEGDAKNGLDEGVTSAGGQRYACAGDAKEAWLVFYLIPPWVHYMHNTSRRPPPIPTPAAATAAAAEAELGMSSSLRETPLLSSRVPFGPQTNSGNLILAHTRTLNRSFKFV